MDTKATHNEHYMRAMSQRELQALGNGQVVYIKPVTIMNRQAFALHAADGTAITLTDSTESAWALALQNDLDPVTLQ